jgi:hypothetical protein
LQENLPPIPDQQPEAPQASLIAYVWRGDKFDEIGLALTQGEGHLIDFHLGAEQTEVIELRGIKEIFYPGYQATKGDPKPTFLAFFFGTEIRAGTAWPHQDGKGHRLKLRQPIPDGAKIELRATGHFVADSGNRRLRTHRPSTRPRISS